MPDEIESLRREIDALDDQLAALLNRRAGLAQRIGALKAGAPAYRPERETEILRRIGGAAKILSRERIVAGFRAIISPPHRREHAIRDPSLAAASPLTEQAVLKALSRSG